MNVDNIILISCCNFNNFRDYVIHEKLTNKKCVYIPLPIFERQIKKRELLLSQFYYKGLKQEQLHGIFREEEKSKLLSK